MSRKSSQAVGSAHLARLENWVTATPLSEVPLNHLGRSSKLTICKALGISPSTVGSNVRIKEVFEKLDAKLLGLRLKQNEKVIYEESVSAAATELIVLLDELDATRAELARLRHLSNTGQWIPEE